MCVNFVLVGSVSKYVCMYIVFVYLYPRVAINQQRFFLWNTCIHIHSHAHMYTHFNGSHIHKPIFTRSSHVMRKRVVCFQLNCFRILSHFSQHLKYMPRCRIFWNAVQCSSIFQFYRTLGINIELKFSS